MTLRELLTRHEDLALRLTTEARLTREALTVMGRFGADLSPEMEASARGLTEHLEAIEELRYEAMGEQTRVERMVRGES